MIDPNVSPAEFTVTFASDNAAHTLTPKTVSIPLLIEALNEIDQGARAYAPPEIAKNKDIPVVSLVEVRLGSLQLNCYSPPEHALYPAAFTTDLEQQNWDRMPLEAYNAARKLHKTTVRLGANLRITSTNKSTAELEMHSSDPAPKREIGMVTGSLNLPGQIIQTGGAKPAIDFRLDANGKILHGISVDTNTARLVGQRLYTPIVIQGHATWNAETWEIEDFKFTGFLEREYQTPSVALTELHGILGKTWNDVNVEEFMADIRGGKN